MRPTPVHLPILTMSLLMGGMAVFILKNYTAAPVDKILSAVGMIAFFAGMIAALVGTIWSICTLTNRELRKTRGITTPVVTILIAALAWSGALLTFHKFMKSRDAQAVKDAGLAADGVRDAE